MTGEMVKYSLAGTLNVLRRQLPRHLVTDDAFARTLAVAGQLPAYMTAGVYWECRLLERDSRVDLILRVGGNGFRILAGRNPHVTLPSHLKHRRAWGQITAFARTWCDTESLCRFVDGAWLEFDLGGRTGAEMEGPDPSVFLVMRRAATAGFSTADWCDLVCTLLGHFGGADRSTRRAVLDAVANRPRNTFIPYVGLMISRSPRPVRLYFSRSTVREIATGLSAMGWAGKPREFEDFVAWLAPRRDTGFPAVGMTHVDVLHEVIDRVGIEFPLSRPEQVRGGVIEKPFLARLVDLDLCSERKKAGLLEWSGHSVESFPHELWKTVTSRRVNCVKLDLQHHVVPEAKAYLLAASAPTRRGRSMANTGERLA